MSLTPFKAFSLKDKIEALELKKEKEPVEEVEPTEEVKPRKSKKNMKGNSTLTLIASVSLAIVVALGVAYFGVTDGTDGKDGIGIKGDRGDSIIGPQGEQGPKGKDGKRADVAIRNVREDSYCSQACNAMQRYKKRYRGTGAGPLSRETVEDKMSIL